MTKFDFSLIESNFEPILHAIHDRRFFGKTREAHAGINALRTIIDANVQDNFLVRPQQSAEKKLAFVLQL